MFSWPVPRAAARARCSASSPASGPTVRARLSCRNSKRLLFLPQKPYVPIGSLRNAVTFPAAPGAFSDAEIVAALRACQLDEQTEHLDQEDHWDRRLSPGEQQRLAVARASAAKAGLAVPGRGDLGA